jgi:hypothetical protein
MRPIDPFYGPTAPAAVLGHGDEAISGPHPDLVHQGRPGLKAVCRGGRVDRRQLEYFLAVAAHGSFTGAAAALRIAQPSLSHAINAVEREVGAQLFHRVSAVSRSPPRGKRCCGLPNRSFGTSPQRGPPCKWSPA